MKLTPMPKTTIDEDRDAPTSEDNVGTHSNAMNASIHKVPKARLV